MSQKKIVIIGATGTIGQALVRAIGTKHQVIQVGHHSGEYQVDITDSVSIRNLFESIGRVDAIVCATGALHLGPIKEMQLEQFRIGINSKLLGQVDVVLIGQHYLNPYGSITLTSGIDELLRHCSNPTTVNYAIDGFVKAAATELPDGQRINSVSPTILQESVERFGSLFDGFEATPGKRVALAYIRSIEGVQTGRVYQVW